MKDLILITPQRHLDERGYFSELYHQKNIEELGVNDIFVQDNHSLSFRAGTLRGLHFQAPPYAQAKLVRCGRGSIFDVAVDIRKGSPSFGQWKGYNLTSENGHQLYIPVGFAHGFLTLEENSEIVYKCSNYYNSQSEGAVYWDDPDISIDWPLEGHPLLSEKDDRSPLLKDLFSPFEWENYS